MGIKYDAEQVRQHLSDAGVWPADLDDDAGVAYARDWWVNLLKQVTYTVNDHDWDEINDETNGIDDAIGEITAVAVDHVVSAAYVNGTILRLLDAADIVHMDVSDEIEIRLHDWVLNSGDGTKGIYPRSGERYDDESYRERMEQARAVHREAMHERLTLASFTRAYLEAAAVTVARPWCEAIVRRYLVQWRCTTCEETFPTEESASDDECLEREECAEHTGEDNCDDHSCSFPHTLVNDEA